MSKEISQYQKFRLQRLNNKSDDDNFSAHFSAKSLSNNQTDRDIQMSLFFQPESPIKNPQSFQLQIKYNQLLEAHQKLKQAYQQKVIEAQKYKDLYHNRIDREKQTKAKLKMWVQEAKQNLPDPN